MFRSSVRPNEDEGRICFIRLTVLSQLSQFGSILMHHDACKIGSGGQHIANRLKSDECSWSVLDYMYIDLFKIKRKSSVQRYRKIFMFQS